MPAIKLSNRLVISKLPTPIITFKAVLLVYKWLHPRSIVAYMASYRIPCRPTEVLTLDPSSMIPRSEVSLWLVFMAVDCQVVRDSLPYEVWAEDASPNDVVRGDDSSPAGSLTAKAGWLRSDSRQLHSAYHAADELYEFSWWLSQK